MSKNTIDVTYVAHAETLGAEVYCCTRHATSIRRCATATPGAWASPVCGTGRRARCARRWLLALDPTADGVRDVRTEFGPVMTSRVDELARENSDNAAEASVRANARLICKSGDSV